jgi:DNA transposition AAA+ family ATPase
MALSTEQRRKLLERELPSIKAVRSQLLDYMERTGLQTGDMARRINYSRVSLYHFVQGRYENVARSSAQVRAAIIDFIAAHPIEPVTETEGGPLYETKNVSLIRNCFNKALNDGQAFYFHGAPGSQKSFVLGRLMAELNLAEISKNGQGKRAFYIYCTENIRPTQLMKEVAIAAGSPSSGDARRIFRNLRFDLGRRKVLFMFDEAQHLSVECLETLRELHDMPPHAGLLFAGSHELKSTFQRLDMEQWHSRLQQGEDLPGIQPEEALNIITAELGELPAKKIKYLISEAEARDKRKGVSVKYISARRLFRSIKGIKNDPRMAKGATA